MKSRYEVYALLFVSRDCQKHMTHILNHRCGIPAKAIVPRMHLTVYHARRLLPGLEAYLRKVHIMADVAETRFMVMAPGGENPRPHLEPSHCSIGIRLTRRNHALREALALRSSFYQYETERVLGKRKPSTATRNAFGARHYQPHVKLLNPGNRVKRDLTELGTFFRTECDWIEFDQFQVTVRHNN